MHSAIQAGEFVLSQTEIRPDTAIVLGSGLGQVLDDMDTTNILEYSAIPGFPTTTVSGHQGQLVLGRVAGQPVALFRGRIHLYEQGRAREVVFPVQLMAQLGVRTMIVTNACGGLNEDLRTGSLVLIRDHLNLTGTNPLIGPNNDAVGPRFPDMSGAYDPDLRATAKRLVDDNDLHEGGVRGRIWSILSVTGRAGHDAIYGRGRDRYVHSLRGHRSQTSGYPDIGHFLCD